MASAKTTAISILVLVVVAAGAIGGIFLMQWTKKRALDQDLRLVEGYLESREPEKAEQVLAQRLEAARPGKAWVTRALALRFKTLEQLKDGASAEALAQQVLDEKQPWAQAGDEAWARAHLVLGRAAIGRKDAAGARAHFDALNTRPWGEIGRAEAEVGLARLEMNSGKTEAAHQRLSALIERLDAGSSARTEAEFALGTLNMARLKTPQPFVTPIKYAIEEGDAIESLCLRFKIQAEAIYGANPELKPGEPLPVGSTITIPITDELHEIKKGDLIVTLAKQYKVPADLIMHVNQISDPKMLHIGNRIKIPNLELSVLVNKTDNTLTLYNYGQFFKKYRVRTGKFEYMTPPGEYKIDNKILDPEWTNPKTQEKFKAGDPGNQLGGFWMGFSGRSLGLHEAVDAQTIGTYSSNGCVGLVHKDIEELFHLLPRLTPVKIVGEIDPVIAQAVEAERIQAIEADQTAR